MVNSQWSNVKVKRGFTLIEILVAIGILATISSVTYVSFDAAKVRARDHTRKEDLKATRGALVAYYQDNDSFPPACSDSCEEATLLSSTPDWIPGLAPGYISTLPDDPLPALFYLYTAPADRTSFRLWASLERAGDKDTASQPTAVCRATPPIPFGRFNYCLEAPQ